MRKEDSTIILDMQKVLDIGITIFSFISAYYIRRNLLPGTLSNLSINPNYYVVLLLIIIAWYISFKWLNVYKSYFQESLLNFSIAILKSCLLGMVLVNITLFLLHIQEISRLLMGIFLILNILLLTLSRYIIFKVLKKFIADDLNITNILIIGSKERALQVIKMADRYKSNGYRILGCFDVDEKKIGQPVFNDYRVIGIVKDLDVYLRDNIVDELVFALPLKLLENGDHYIAYAESMGIKVRIIPDWEIHYLMYRPDIATIKFEKFLNLDTMAIQSTPLNEGKMSVKYFSDYMVAVALTIILLPVFISIGAAIKLFSKGDILYKQERLGMNGRHFNVYKFRTMVADADERLKELQEMNEADGPAFKIKNDPRIIPYIGTFLRKTSLDELPQIFNVLKGEMSLVGPRPPIPKEVDEYSVWHRRRLSMKPGMTCLWQIAPRRNDLSFEEWMKLDLKYIDNWSLFIDLKILLLTAKAVLMGSGR